MKTADLIGIKEVYNSGFMYKICDKCNHIMKDKYYMIARQFTINDYGYCYQDSNGHLYTPDFITLGVCPVCKHNSSSLHDAALSDVVSYLKNKDYFVIYEFSGAYSGNDLNISLIINDECQAESFINTFRTIAGKKKTTYIDELGNTVARNTVSLFQLGYISVDDFMEGEEDSSLNEIFIHFRHKYLIFIAPNDNVFSQANVSRRNYRDTAASLVDELTRIMKYMPNNIWRK